MRCAQLPARRIPHNYPPSGCTCRWGTTGARHPSYPQGWTCDGRCEAGWWGPVWKMLRIVPMQPSQTHVASKNRSWFAIGCGWAGSAGVMRAAASPPTITRICHAAAHTCCVAMPCTAPAGARCCGAVKQCQISITCCATMPCTAPAGARCCRQVPPRAPPRAPCSRPARKWTSSSRWWVNCFTSNTPYCCWHCMQAQGCSNQ